MSEYYSQSEKRPPWTHVVNTSCEYSAIDQSSTYNSNYMWFRVYVGAE